MTQRLSSGIMKRAIRRKRDSIVCYNNLRNKGLRGKLDLS